MSEYDMYEDIRASIRQAKQQVLESFLDYVEQYEEEAENLTIDADELYSYIVGELRIRIGDTK
jgi:uncharacterized protein (UPF0335 family)